MPLIPGFEGVWTNELLAQSNVLERLMGETVAHYRIDIVTLMG